APGGSGGRGVRATPKPKHAERSRNPKDELRLQMKSGSSSGMTNKGRQPVIVPPRQLIYFIDIKGYGPSERQDGPDSFGLVIREHGDGLFHSERDIDGPFIRAYERTWHVMKASVV